MGTLNNYKEKALLLKSQYEKYIPAAFFALGFAFDLITLGRIDSTLTITSQAAYLLFITWLLGLISLEHYKLLNISERWQKLWKYRHEILHFLFGALLSAYSLFYFMSASLATSLLFMFLLALLLILNETPRLKSLGPTFKYALLTLCYISYWSYFIPVLIGSTGYLSLALSVIATLICLFLIYKWFLKKKMSVSDIRKNVFFPSGMVLVSFLVLFFLQAIPPVPLSIQYIGMYHSIIKPEGTNKYQLGYNRPLWKFWENGSQSFKAMPGQKIYCFARIFSPSAFDDKVVFHWQFKHPKWGWQSMDRVPIRIIGGRDEGFRAYVGKAKHQPGDWVVKVETTDGREIGRLSFSVEHTEKMVHPTQLDHF